MLRHGENANFLQRVRAAGLGDPKAIRSQPKLFEDLQPVWDSWCQLARARTTGFGANPVTVSDAAAWLDCNGVPQHQRPRWLRYLLAMDSTYRQWLDESRKEKQRDSNS